MVTQSKHDYQFEKIDAQFNELKAMVLQAAKQGEHAHVVEQRLCADVFRLAYELFGRFLIEQPSDDLGATLELPDGRTLRQCKPQNRDLFTLFGKYSFPRLVYAVREGQRAEVIPFDQRLALPESPFSYTLQDWCQSLSVEVAFRPVTKTLLKFLGVKMTVSSIENLCQHSAESVAAFQDSCDVPLPEEEGEILVETIDHKGVPMIRSAVVPSEAHRTKGKKPKKRMAALGSVYSVDPHVRTPEELNAILFHEARPAAAPPEPQGRRYWGSLSREVNGTAICGQNEVLTKMTHEVSQRRQPGQVLLYLTDGQRSLENGGHACLPRDADTVEILDLMHVAQRLWEASHLFHTEGSTEASAFVRKQQLRTLQGDAAGVVVLLKQKATKRKLHGLARKRLDTLCGFFLSNLHRMRYHEYLAQGYPISTGVIEGACRHVIKDRMERTGMRWGVPGAQAMLQLRTIHANDSWDEFHEFRIETETLRLYPYQNVLPRDKSAAAA